MTQKQESRAKKKKQAPARPESKKIKSEALALQEIRKLVPHVKASQILHSQRYLYFSLQPSFDNVAFQVLKKSAKLTLIGVFNVKNSLVGYLVTFGQKPHIDIDEDGIGAAVFFSKRESHQRPKIFYSDQKMRALSFSNDDFFFSVKWKSQVTPQI